MTLWFETHATSVDNEARLASGWYDAALSALGEQQARELGERRRADTLAAIYCSDLRRSYDTAAIAFAGQDVLVIRDARLRECDYGTMTRWPTDLIEAERLSRIVEPFPSGESYETATNRVATWLDEVRERHTGQTILVIGHRATSSALEHLCGGRPLADVIAAPWTWQPGWLYPPR